MVFLLTGFTNHHFLFPPKETYSFGGRNSTGVRASEVHWLEHLEEENQCLKQMVADLSLDKHMLQDVLSKSSEAVHKRALVNILEEQ